MLLAGRRYVEGGSYVPTIDGLRAIAVLSVLLFHLIPSALPGGFVGVDVFFVISGYVVTNAMIRQRDKPFRYFIIGFYARRFRRIVPPLVLCLCIMIPVAFAVIPDAYLSQAIPKTALYSFFGLSNFALVETADGYFATPTIFNPFMHTWSLAVEEQFYVISPMLFYLAAGENSVRFKPAARWAVIITAVGSLGFCAWSTFKLPDIAYYTLPSRTWELALGTFAAMIGERRRQTLVDYSGQALLTNVGVALVVIATATADERMFPFPWALPACFGTAAVIVGSARSNTIWSLGRVLESRLAVSIGLLSYSLYLWHWPIYTVLRWTIGLQSPASYGIAICLTAIFAWLSYWLVEYPTQNWSLLNRSNPIVTIAVSIVVVIFGYIICDHPWGYKQTVVEKNRSDWYPSAGGGIGSGMPCKVAEQAESNGITLLTPYNCSSPATTAPRIFVIGDSHAGAYKRMLRYIVAKTGLSVSIESGIACNEADFLAPSSLKQIKCASPVPYSELVLRKIKPNDIVFIASLRSVRLSTQTGPVAKATIQRLTNSSLARANREAAASEANLLIKRLSKSGAKTILDLPLPVFKAPAFRCSDWFNSNNPICAAGLTVPLNELRHLRQPVVDAMWQTAASNTRVYLWDPFAILCPIDPCSAYRNHRPLFFDGDHLSGYGNDLIAPSFLDLIERVLATGGSSRSALTPSSRAIGRSRSGGSDT